MRRCFASAIREVFLALALCTFLPSTAHAQSDLDRAYGIISSKTFVDLTHSFSPETPVWSGFGQAKMSPAADPTTHEPYTIAKDGFRATYYRVALEVLRHVGAQGNK